MAKISVTDLRRNMKECLYNARTKPVIITSHNKEAFILISFKHYNHLLDLLVRTRELAITYSKERKNLSSLISDCKKLDDEYVEIIRR